MTTDDPTPRPLRILQINSLFGSGGVDIQTMELSAGLRALGDDVTLAINTGSAWEQRARDLGVRVETFPARVGLKLPMIAALARIIREQRIDIVHAHHGRDYWPAIMGTWIAGRRPHVVLTRHLMTRPSPGSRALLLRNAHIIAVSRAVENVLRNVLRGPAQRIHRVPPGIDFSRFLPERTDAAWSYRKSRGWTDDAVVFALVGTFHAPTGKGQLLFLDAAAQLVHEFPQARFVMLGYGEMREEIIGRIAALGLGGVAELMNFHDEVPLFMSAIDVLVHPTVVGEAFPLVTIEALASGRPVVASRKDGIVDCVIDREHGLLLPPGDAPALADAMRTMLTQPELRRRYGEAGRDHVRATFTRDALARRVRDIYTALT